MNKFGPYFKAVAAFLAPGAVTLTAAVQESSHMGTAVSSAEWITAACSMIITAGAVYATPAPGYRSSR